MAESEGILAIINHATTQAVMMSLRDANAGPAVTASQKETKTWQNSPRKAFI